MDTTIIRPSELSAAQLSRWQALQATRPDLGTPFLSPHWVRAVEKAQADDAVRVAAIGPHGQEEAFFSARVGRFTARPVGSPMCDYQGVVSDKGVRVDARELVAAFGVQSFEYAEMLAYDGTFAQFSRGRQTSHIVNVPDGYATYEAQRKEAGVGALKDADKKRRKVEREVGPVTASIFSRSSADFAQMLAWKSAQFSETGQIDIFATPWTKRLLHDLFESRRPEFGGMLCTLHFGDELAAAQFHLHGAEVIHAWFITHNPKFERYSPGMLMFQDILRWMDGTPYNRLDLGVGDYRFKRELANAGQSVTQGFVGSPIAPAFLARRAAYGAIRAAEALPLGGVSALPAKALRRIDRWRALR